MTTDRAWAIRNGKAADAPLVEQYAAWRMEADHLEEQERRHRIKSTSDWHHLQRAKRMRDELLAELLNPVAA